MQPVLYCCVHLTISAHTFRRSLQMGCACMLVINKATQGCHQDLHSRLYHVAHACICPAGRGPIPTAFPPSLQQHAPLPGMAVATKENSSQPAVWAGTKLKQQVRNCVCHVARSPTGCRVQPLQSTAHRCPITQCIPFWFALPHNMLSFLTCRGADLFSTWFQLVRPEPCCPP
jgi:hypothetical protein